MGLFETVRVLVCGPLPKSRYALFLVHGYSQANQSSRLLTEALYTGTLCMHVNKL